MTNCSCAAANCNYNRRNVRKQMLDIVFHSFPAEAELRQKWVKFCRRGSGWEPKHTDALCSVHFRKEDYQMAKSPIMRPGNLRRLNVRAYPTIYNGAAIPLAKNLKIERENQQKLKQELYKKDGEIDIDEICELKYGIKQQRTTSSILSKIVYRLRSFPNMCAFCFKTITVETVYVPFSSHQNKLQCTIGEKFDEITGMKNYGTDGITLDHLLPDKACVECVEELIKFHEYQRRLQCLRKFSIGLARLLKGNRKPLQTLYQEQGSYLATVLKNVNICPGPEENVTLERLEMEVATYGPIRKYTLFKPTPPPKIIVPTRLKSEKVGNQTPVKSNNSPPERTPGVCDNPDPLGTDMEELEEEIENVKMSQAAAAAAATASFAQKPSTVQQQTNAAEKSRRGRPRAEGTPQRTWMCPYVAVCKEILKDEASLKLHMANRHKYFYCKACGSKLLFYDVYIKHIESHAIARALLLSHNKKEPQTVLDCKSCGKQFVSEELLRRHETTHVGERVFVCGTCLGSFTTNTEFDKHKCPTVEMPVESGVDPFTDDVCAEPAQKRPPQKRTTTNFKGIDSKRIKIEDSNIQGTEDKAEYLEEALLEDDTEDSEIED